jgi:hypothetical protein
MVDCRIRATSASSFRQDAHVSTKQRRALERSGPKMLTSVQTEANSSNFEQLSQDLELRNLFVRLLLNTEQASFEEVHQDQCITL